MKIVQINTVCGIGSTGRIVQDISEILTKKGIENYVYYGQGKSSYKLAKKIGISSQFLGLVEDGKGNLVYRSVRKLRDLSGHSADYILYGLDDSVINKTKELLNNYTEQEIHKALELLNEIAIFIKK